MRFHNGEHFEFYVNEDKRTVVAVLEVPVNAMGEEMLNMLNKASGHNFAVEDCLLGNTMLLKGKYVGKATCHNEDEWDEGVGMQLAKLRALKAYNADRKKIAKKMTEIFKNAVERLEQAEEYVEYSNEHIDDAIEDIEED